MWWTSTDEPAPEWAEVTLTPADFTRLSTFVTKTGASVTLVVDLGHNDPARAADMVFHARRSLGDRLIAVSVGNEPNGFALASQPQYRMREDGYSPAQFVAEARPYVEAIHAKAPEVGIVGPGTFDAPRGSYRRCFDLNHLPLGMTQLLSGLPAEIFELELRNG